MEAAPIVDSALARTAGHLMAAKMFSLASCVMLFYDIFLTFSDEVEKVWRKKFTPVTFLWFMNRYLSPLGYIVIIVLGIHGRNEPQPTTRPHGLHSSWEITAVSFIANFGMSEGYVLKCIGIIYFAVIFVANLVTVLIFLFAPLQYFVSGLRAFWREANAGVVIAPRITSLMVSRLMLNLRGFLEHDRRVSVLPPSQYGFEMRASTRGSSAVSKGPV
ncbi:hypothetical protein EYR38_002513 [Pleurotus pulmonarius]|nr:hypothetical protein EYR38_002513 [Pleurotus pulmonarius]